MKITASSLITSWQIDGETMETVTDFIFLGSKITEDGDCSQEIKRCLLSGRKVMTNLDSILKKQRHYFANKGPSSQNNSFSSSHVWMWELGYKESWAPKNWCFWTMVLEKILESPLDCKEIQPVHPKKKQSWAAVLRWWRNRMGRPLSPQQIQQKNIWMLSKFHKTSSECRQKTSGTQKSSPLSSKGGMKKYKR